MEGMGWMDEMATRKPDPPTECIIQRPSDTSGTESTITEVFEAALHTHPSKYLDCSVHEVERV